MKIDPFSKKIYMERTEEKKLESVVISICEHYGVTGEGSEEQLVEQIHKDILYKLGSIIYNIFFQIELINDGELPEPVEPPDYRVIEFLRKKTQEQLQKIMEKKKAPAEKTGALS